MAVLTYEIEEVQEETVEECDEAKRLIDELGLTGQKMRATPKDKPRVPFREMTEEEVAVYKTLCPQETAVENYDCGDIPVRVLQVVAFAKPIFKRLTIWHPQSTQKDPVLVGYTSSWGGSPHILARWGAELDEWPALLKRAAETYRFRTLDVLETMARRIQAWIKECADGITIEEFTSRRGELPSMHWRQ